MARVHRIKSWPISFDAILEGAKTFDLRVNDRDYRVGDYVDLHKFDPNNGVFMGESQMRKITFIQEIDLFDPDCAEDGPFSITYAILSYAPLAPSNELVDAPIEVVEPSNG